MLAFAGVLLTGMVGCAPASSGTSAATTEAAASAASTVDADSFKSKLKGDWKCAKKGTGSFSFLTDDGTKTGFSLYDNGAYELSIGDTDWRVANVPWKYGDFDETRSSGTYTLDGTNLVFKIEKYEYMDGTIEKPSHTLSRDSIGKTFTVSGVPLKFSERAYPQIKDHNHKDPARYMPTPTGFSLQRSSETSLDCIMTGSRTG